MYILPQKDSEKTMKVALIDGDLSSGVGEAVPIPRGDSAIVAVAVSDGKCLEQGIEDFWTIEGQNYVVVENGKGTTWSEAP